MRRLRKLSSLVLAESILDWKTRACPSRRAATMLALIGLLTANGCSQNSEPHQAASIEPASYEIRAKRRAYDGAPPTIPHAPFGQDCTTCHTEIGKEIPTIGFAPANPHFGDRRAGALTNCAQCHLFSESDRLFVENQFQGLPDVRYESIRANRLAPPVLPHSVNMRSNCMACHAGVAARPEILCSHPERSNCSQCHLAIESNNAMPAGLTKLRQ